MEEGSSFSSGTLSPDFEDTTQTAKTPSHPRSSIPQKRKNDDDNNSHPPPKAPRIEALNATSVGSDSPWQSIALFHEVVANAPLIPAKYASLNADQKLGFALGVRNLFLATSRSGSSRAKDKEILERMVDILDEDDDLVVVGGMSVSCYPSRRHTILKFIENLDRKIQRRKGNYFAQVMTTPRLFAVFVNPAELSYHNFENIVPLDAWVESKTGVARESGSDRLVLELGHVKKLQVGTEVFTAKLDCGDNKTLLREISDLSLYVAPLNKGTRGGERFIFHSAILSKALTSAVKTSGLLGSIANGRLGGSFEFANYVFRSNKFAPSDGKFENHLDTPYYDRVRNHVSKYTLLIYLSTGQNEPVLRIQDVDINRVEEMTCVIFDQKYQHEGRPFVDGDKVFLRTELVFKDETLARDARASELFSTACYMTGQSIFDKELASYAHDCFERANSLHWALGKDSSSDSVYLMKEFRGVRFVTNGYNYWFPKPKVMDVKGYVVICILDYFNCKIDKQSFRSISNSTTIKEKFTSSNDIWKFLAAQTPEQTQPIRRLRPHDLESLIKRTPDKPFVGLIDEDPDIEHLEETDLENPCCFFHTYPLFNPLKNKDVMEVFEKCCAYTRGKILCSPILMLDQEVLLNEENIQIVGDKIHILQDVGKGPLPPVNFAACWGDAPMPEAFITLDREVVVPKLLVPPVQFCESVEGVRFGVDFFRNDWMVDVEGGRTVGVPVVTERPVEEGNPFFEGMVDVDEEMEELLEELEESVD